MDPAAACKHAAVAVAMAAAAAELAEVLTSPPKVADDGSRWDLRLPPALQTKRRTARAE